LYQGMPLGIPQVRVVNAPLGAGFEAGVSPQAVRASVSARR